jgi:hypothetical protein
VRTTDTVSAVRQAAEDPRLIEGIVVPYGKIAGHTDVGPEAFAPGAFREDVSRWMGRTDGARLPYRPAHGERAIGSVVALATRPMASTSRPASGQAHAGTPTSRTSPTA